MAAPDRTPVLLIVDDEEMVLTSLRSFLMLETEYEVLTFSSSTEALEAAKSQTIDLVVSDYLMPEMTGIELLLGIKKLQPYATRILLTGYADKENAIKAINEVGLYQYVEKPWDNNDLKLVIENGLERRFLMERLEQKITEVQQVQQNLQDIQAQIIKAFM
jgi:response regulator RpfG family c-di-GMP phosphodiesterase